MPRGDGVGTLHNCRIRPADEAHFCQPAVFFKTFALLYEYSVTEKIFTSIYLFHTHMSPVALVLPFEQIVRDRQETLAGAAAVGASRWHATPTRPRRRGRRRNPRTRMRRLPPRGTRPPRCAPYPETVSSRRLRPSTGKAPIDLVISSPRPCHLVVAGESRTQTKGKRGAPDKGRASVEGRWRQKVQDMQGGERSRSHNAPSRNRRRRRPTVCHQPSTHTPLILASIPRFCQPRSSRRRSFANPGRRARAAASPGPRTTARTTSRGASP